MMGRKQSRIFVILPLLALAGAAAILAVSCSKGNGVDSQGAVALSSLTPIANCIVDSSDDVEVGGPDALPGCDTVVLEPAPADPTAFGAIDVEAGGTLEIGGAKTATSSATTPTERLRQICVDGGKVTPEGKNKFDATNDHRVVIEFYGNANYKPTGKLNACEEEGFLKGIDVRAGGTLILTGEKGVPSTDGVSWTTLAAPAGSNVDGAKEPVLSPSSATRLYLTADVTKGPSGEGWQQGDWIVVATTDYTPYHSEFVQIASANSGSGGVAGAGSWVTLEQPLEYYHFGSLAPSSATATCPNPFYAAGSSATATQPAFLCDGPTQNYGVDERAEVGLISRDLTLTAETAPIVSQENATDAAAAAAATLDEHWGGEIMIHQGFTKVVIQGVRISKFGKAKLGSYPIHFHRVGTIGQSPNSPVQSVLVDADSVDHSYNKCVTIHATSNLTIKNLVCARIVGQIFYEELNDANALNPADDSDIVFDHDLGIGSMSNTFDIYDAVDVTKQPPNNDISRADMIAKYWWTGDYMTNDPGSSAYINYDGFNIPNTANWRQAVHGVCYGPPVNGLLVGHDSPNEKSTTAACPPANGINPDRTIYMEPTSGFWIQNPGTTLTNDAIAGCQGESSAYWWALPTNAIDTKNANGATVSVQLKWQPLGTVKDLRASACEHAYFAENEDLSEVAQYWPHKNGKQDGTAASDNIISVFYGLTATHNRWRALWLRPSWFVIKDSHFADNRHSATMLTSGGIDGNAPGVWQLLEDSVIVGESRDNVGRWGPCPRGSLFGANSGGQYGCIDFSHPPSGSAHSGAMQTQGYPFPGRNSFGYLLYDGPALVFHDRFVNFNYNKNWNKGMPCNQPGTPSPGAFYRELDDPDCAALKFWEETSLIPTVPPPASAGPPTPYEGDAAFGWFPSNISAYPNATASRQLMWVNSNLRHQIYTEYVNIAKFNDSDKNTAIIDEDGTLSGLAVEKAPGSGTNPVHAISLNNLPFNAVSNAVDECLSGGAQDQWQEGRESSLMSPAVVGTLEFGMLYPYVENSDLNNPYAKPPGEPNSHWQEITFTRTDPAAVGSHGRPASMTMQSGRDGLGIWEPKVANGYGYYLMAAPNNTAEGGANNPHKAGIGKWVDVGVADVVDFNITKDRPYYIRLGIDYATVVNGAKHEPADNFRIVRGFKSYSNGDFNSASPSWKPYWIPLDCHSLDDQNRANVPTKIDEKAGKGYCPAAAPNAATVVLTEATSIGQLTNSDGSPNLNVYYYDTSTGYLWLNVAQNEPNALGPSPLGSCPSKDDPSMNDPNCPWNHGESYYACPTDGCIIYGISMNDPAYVPGPSTGRPDPANLWKDPAQPNKLKVIYGANPGTIVDPQTEYDKHQVPYHVASTATEPACPVTQHDGG